MRIQEIQAALKEQQLDGWLFFDHHNRDPLAYRVLQFEPGRTPTRRWYYYIPAEGEPQRLVHQVEPTMLDALPGVKRTYSGWAKLSYGLQEMTSGSKRIAMQYSPNCNVMYVSMVDAGTIEQVRALGLEVVSSADLIQIFEAKWDQAKFDSHMAAGERVDRVRAEAFVRIGDEMRAGRSVTEFDIAEFIRRRFTEEGLFTDHGPIVAVNANASNPHYEPEQGISAEIRPGDLVLIDMWAKLNQPGAVYYDITWTGYCGETPTAEMQKVFDVVTGARDAAVRKVQTAFAAGLDLRGFEVDDASRGHIRDNGFVDYFIHRTGHSIGEDVHGSGANMDNLETHDERRVIPWTCFSVEPGVYLPAFGIRSEVNVFTRERDAMVTGEIQRALVRIV